jgi:ArsR family metal-binding transcriptional regulator
MIVNRIDTVRPECLPASEIVSAKVYLDDDISGLFPYINSVMEKAQYFPKGPFIRFLWEGHPVTAQPGIVVVNIFEDDKAAREGAEKVVEFLQEIELRTSEITLDYSPYDPPKVLDIFKLLPKKTGCGECGHPTCMAFSVELAAGNKKSTECEVLVIDPDYRENLEELQNMLCEN